MRVQGGKQWKIVAFKKYMCTLSTLEKVLTPIEMNVLEIMSHFQLSCNISGIDDYCCHATFTTFVQLRQHSD